MVSPARLSVLYESIPLGERIRAARLAAGLNNADLVGVAGFSAVDLKQIEAGRRFPRFTRLATLAERIGTALDLLLAPAIETLPATGSGEAIIVTPELLVSGARGRDPRRVLSRSWRRGLPDVPLSGARGR